MRYLLFLVETFGIPIPFLGGPESEKAWFKVKFFTFILFYLYVFVGVYWLRVHHTVRAVGIKLIGEKCYV
jgi:hypothetical protein